MESLDTASSVTVSTGNPSGCPSGLQVEPVTGRDPLAGQLDLSSYVRKTGTDKSELELIVQGAHCAGCLNKIENGVSEIPGVTDVRMNLSTLRLRVSWTGEITHPGQVVSKLVSLGFAAAPYDISVAQTNSEAELKSLLRAIAVAGFAAMNVMLLSIAVWSGGDEMGASTRTLFHWISALIAVPTVIYSGRIFFKSAWGVLKLRETNMDVPISLALILACTLSLYETVMGNPDTYFDAAVMLLFLLLIGRYLDSRLRLRAGEAARQLAALQSTTATRILPRGGVETVPAHMIVPGDILLIPAGQNIPVDCCIESGQSDVDMQIATGETVPQSFGPGDTLYSGTTNLTAPLKARAISASSDSFLADITAMVELGEQKKSRYVRIADRAAQAYVPVVHSIALMTFLGWFLIGGDLRTASINAIAVLIITCPCALGLAVPAVQIVTTGRLFKQGVLLRSGDALERLAKIRSVIFDKTGTLTTGELVLVNESEITRHDIHIAAALSQYSNHPICKAIQKYDAINVNVQNVREHPGLGVSAEYRGQPVKFGSAVHVGEEPSGSVTTQSWLKLGGGARVKFLFSDHVRADAYETTRQLLDMGLDVELLSGDRSDIVGTTAASVGIKTWQGDAKPAHKLKHIKALQENGYASLMVGDGINDAPALAAATASASLATASDISRSVADVILQGDRLSGVLDAIRLARKAQKRVIENLGFATLYNFLAIPLAVFGIVNPLIAALAMSGSSLLVTLNALRMARA